MLIGKNPDHGSQEESLTADYNSIDITRKKNLKTKNKRRRRRRTLEPKKISLSLSSSYRSKIKTVLSRIVRIWNAGRFIRLF
ncbi:hypothetical protein EUTSA_v10011906mg [Eutrema salsugineum]|uniref:Uncharacterized protein n=1 Tax=Eutrema salsugineum TaxID=72664 RepID=V4KTB6_EUTSA|nr:hypothetical protein EUTSA_v10011906mg [Eutrema salsugineum]